MIDPVDGTYNFHHGLSWWCSAIALVDADDVLLGAVFHPHDDVLFVGGPGPARRPATASRWRPWPTCASAETCATTYLHPPFDDPDDRRGLHPGRGRRGHHADARLRDHGRDGDRAGTARGQLPAHRGRLGPAARAPPSSAASAARHGVRRPAASSGRSPARPRRWRRSARRSRPENPQPGHDRAIPDPGPEHRGGERRRRRGAAPDLRGGVHMYARSTTILGDPGSHRRRDRPRPRRDRCRR